MKRMVCTMVLITPMLGWAQSDGKGVTVAEDRPLEPAKTATVVNQSATREIALPQVLDRLSLNAPQQSLWESFSL